MEEHAEKSSCGPDPSYDYEGRRRQEAEKVLSSEEPQRKRRHLHRHDEREVDERSHDEHDDYQGEKCKQPAKGKGKGKGKKGKGKNKRKGAKGKGMGKDKGGKAKVHRRKNNCYRNMPDEEVRKEVEHMDLREKSFFLATQLRWDTPITDLRLHSEGWYELQEVVERSGMDKSDITHIVMAGVNSDGGHRFFLSGDGKFIKAEANKAGREEIRRQEADQDWD